MFTIDELDHACEIVHRTLPATPQIRWPLLCERVGADVWVKHENHTPIGAFKIRGALFYFSELRRKNPETKEVIAATRGNFGQSVAFAGSRAGLRTVIVVPHGNSREQNAAMRGLGAELIEFGHDFQDALEHAGHLAKGIAVPFYQLFQLGARAGGRELRARVVSECSESGLCLRPDWSGQRYLRNHRGEECARNKNQDSRGGFERCSCLCSFISSR